MCIVPVLSKIPVLDKFINNEKTTLLGILWTDVSA